METRDLINESNVSEGGGLRVTYNDGDSSFTLEWNSESHPEYNYLNDFSESELSEHLLGALKEQLDDLESTTTNGNNAD